MHPLICFSVRVPHTLSVPGSKGVFSFAAWVHLSVIQVKISVPTVNAMHPVRLLQVQPPRQPELCCPAV